MSRERSPRHHRRQAERYRRHLLRTERLIGRIAIARFVAFVVFAGAAFSALYDRLPLVYGPFAAGGLFAFGIAVWMHRRPYRLAPRLKALATLHDQAAARLEGDWGALELDGARFLGDEPHLGELQLFGRCSAYQQICRATLPAARARLAELLREGLAPEAIAPRQAAAQELAGLTVFRHRLEAEGRLVQLDEAAQARFLAWAEAPPDPIPERLRWVARVLVPLTLLQALAAALLPQVHTQWRVCLLLQAILYGLSTLRLGRLIAPLVDRGQHQPIVSLRRMFELVEQRPFSATLLADLKRRLLRGGAPSRVLARLEATVQGLAVRHNALLYGAVNVILLWEIFHTAALMRWRRAHGHALRAQLAGLADLEALCSAGGFAHDRPGYAWPQVSEACAPVVQARGLGHPLIPADRRRSNDFTIASGGRLVLITGSNMSGKSSFLRTIGFNVVLAQAGLPVCADALALQACALSTSIQVVDAPEAGLSLFYMEVKRIRRILDAVANLDSRPRLYLIDEMLRGTNSRERNLASFAIARALVASPRSYGLVTTHDLSLIRLADELPDQIDAWHFTDHFDGERLHFDYQLRPGVAATTNALHVLRMEGIEVEGIEVEGIEVP